MSLDVTDPGRVSEREFDQRVAAGSEGQANYRAGETSIPRVVAVGSLSSSVIDNPSRLIVGGLVGGLFIGLVAAFVWARLDHRILDKDEAEQYFGLPVIAEIPKLRNREKRNPVVMSRDEPMSHIAEAYRSLRSSLIYAHDFGDAASDADAADASTEGTVVLVTSPGASEGKTSTVANLANVLAEEEYSVLAVNCDFRRPRLAYFLDGDPEPRRLSKTSIEGVRMINHVTAEGSEAHPTDVVRSQKRVIAQAKERFDVVLLDTAPLLATNDANEVLPCADLVLIVAQVGRTTKEGAEATRELLERRRAPVAGVVLIGSDSAATVTRVLLLLPRPQGFPLQPPLRSLQPPGPNATPSTTSVAEARRRSSDDRRPRRRSIATSPTKTSRSGSAGDRTDSPPARHPAGGVPPTTACTDPRGPLGLLGRPAHSCSW